MKESEKRHETQIKDETPFPDICVEPNPPTWHNDMKYSEMLRKIYRQKVMRKINKLII